MSRRKPSKYHGLLPVWKESGPTSHDIVDIARKALRERRIGHTGTLDPMAEGLLILCIGRATRLQQFMLSWNKTYHGVIQLGSATTTYDREGDAIEPTGEPPQLDGDELKSLEEGFFGQFEQLPPPYSAKKVGGKKLYELARKGEETPLVPKVVSVLGLELTAAERSQIELEVTVGSGFYVRSLAHDIGLKLGCGGHLHHLRRLSIGPYNLENAIKQADLSGASSAEDVLGSNAWIPLERIKLPFPEVTINPGARDRFVHGQELVIMHATDNDFRADSKLVVRAVDGDFIGIGIVQHVLARGRTINIKPAMVL